MPSIDALVCRRARHLVCYWRGTQFVVDNYATGVRAAVPPLAHHALSFFEDWCPVRTLLANSPPSTHAALRQLVADLVRHSLLHRSDRTPSPRERAMDSWQPWNPTAGFFHTGTKDVPFVDIETQVRALRRKSRTSPMPAVTKRYSGRLIRLPPCTADSEFPSVLLARRTWRQFAGTRVDLASFGALLALTARIQRWAHVEGEGRVALKTSPSGGARHSVELYVLALKVRGLRPGLYHYAADDHGLALIGRRASAGLIERYLPTQWWYRRASALVMFAAVFPRELWRYGYARAYRAVLIEAGHLCQTFCLTATWLGLAPFCSMALADSVIEKDLKLDGITESVLYAAGVGTRPTGLEPPRSNAGRSPSMLTRGEVQRFPGRIARRRSR
jgi:SagB-type dehydrogenase family enzyme